MLKKKQVWELLKTSAIFLKRLKLEFLSKIGQMLGLMISSVSVRIRKFLKLRSNEQHRWTSFGIQYQNLRCKTSRLKQTCMLFSVWSRLKKDEIHLQVKNILQYGCYIFQTFLLCAMGPYLSANKKSFEYSLNWRNSGEMYTVGHQGYHGGLSTEVFFKEHLCAQST